MALKFEFIRSVFVVLSLTALLVNSTSQGWWSLGLSGCANKGGNCNNCASLAQDGVLSNNQENVCAEDGNGADTVPAIARGTRQAILQCQTQFECSRWNCTTFIGDNLFGSFVSENRTRETAAVFSYLTAGATHALAEACREQRISTCPCITDSTYLDFTEANVVFSVCSDNTLWAIEYIRRFLASSSSSGSNVGDMCDQQNIKVGSKLVFNTGKFCRCHGVSGTCSTQTCYGKAPELSEVGENILTGYSGAVPVALVDGNLERAGPILADPLRESDLAYVDESPNFCNPNRERGILGTAHRICDPSRTSAKSCEVLCCGRGYYTISHVEPVEKCRFVYCCEIKCETVSNITITEYRCNP